MSSYRLASSDSAAPASLGVSLKRLAPLVGEERHRVAAALAAVVLSSLTTLVGPLVISHAVDTAIRTGDYPAVLRWSALLLGVYVVGLVATYLQTRLMGTVGRRVLYLLRNRLFETLQQLPLAFFAQNKAGDLISRINNDTDKLNQFFSQGLVQFAGNLVMMSGAALFLLSLEVRLGAVALLPAAVAMVITSLVSPWAQRRNLASLRALGAVSGEVQESLANFMVIVAFNRRDYFRSRFEEANTRNYAASVRSGLANGLFLPVYGLAHYLAQALVLVYGLVLAMRGEMTIGVLVGFLLYINSFYMPLRQLAAVWATFQLALAALDRVSGVLSLESNLPVIPSPDHRDTGLLSFESVSFHYDGGKDVLRDASLRLERGKTYALVGPTGGGKTTTASLMARLYDPTGGRVWLDGRDIRSYTPAERATKIGFILQEPFLFTGTIRDNLVCGNGRYDGYSVDALRAVLAERRLDVLLTRFPEGLDTRITASHEGLSLGQKQVVAFLRAVLRDPELLILDEATANIDTVTEQLLEQILETLPATTTRIIIAHRLNTIANADEIFFVNAGTITPAGSLDHAVEMLLHHRRAT